MVNVNVTGGEMSQAEINSYIDRAQKLYPEKTVWSADGKKLHKYVYPTHL